MTKLKLLFALILGLAFAMFAQAAEQPDPNSTLSDFKGRVTVEEGKSSTPGKLDMRLNPGDKLVTRARSAATVIYDDQCREDIGENKVFTVSELSGCACRLRSEQKSSAEKAAENSTLRKLKGSVSVNQGKAFSPAVPDMRLKPGDRIMTQAGSGGTLFFDDGCQLDVEANKLVTVPEESTCLCGLLLVQGLTPAGGAAIGGATGGVGGAVGAGVAVVGLCLTVFCTEDDDDDASP